MMLWTHYIRPTTLSRFAMRNILCSVTFFFFLIIRRPPISPLFPYRPLFRSDWPPRKQCVIQASEPHPDDEHDRQTEPRGEVRAGLGCVQRYEKTPDPLYHDDLGEPRQLLDRKSTRLNSSHSQISYAVFCLKK